MITGMKSSETVNPCCKRGVVGGYLKYSLMLICLIASISTRAQRDGIHREIKNVNDVVNDTFYYKRNDTMYHAVRIATTQKIVHLNYYLKEGDAWVMSNNSFVPEKAQFKKKKYGIRFIFRRSKYKEFTKE